MKKNKNSFISVLLSNNLVLFCVSLFIAFGIWFITSSLDTASNADTNSVISNLPVTITLSEEANKAGLKVIDADKIKASVEVSGNRLSIGSLSSEDIEVYALDSTSINAPGNYTLALMAKKKGVKQNYNFVGDVSPKSVSVRVDKMMSLDRNIESELVCKVNKGYYANTSLSETKVTISGPQEEVSKVNRVVVRGILESKSTSEVKQDFELIFLDQNDNPITLTLAEPSITQVTATLKPLPTKKVKLGVEVVNAPKDYPKIKIEPSEIEIAAEKEKLDALKGNVLNIGTIDFSEFLNKKETVEFDILVIGEYENTNKNAKRAKVSIDLSDYSTKMFTIDSYVSQNIDLDKYNIDYNNAKTTVTICGPEDTISKMKASDVISKVDFMQHEENSDNSGKDGNKSSSKSSEGEYQQSLENIGNKEMTWELPVTLELKKGYEDCWIYGKYKITATVTKKK